MSAYHLAHTPAVIAMLILIACIIYLRRRHSQMAVGSWVVGISFLLLGQVCWFFYDGGSWHPNTAHTLRLLADLLAGAAFLMYSRGQFHPRRMLQRHGWNLLALVLLEIFYGAGCQRPAAYVFCALAGIAGVIQSAGLHRPKYLTVGWILLWMLIACAAVFDGYRTAAYWGLASVYGIAAMNLWKRLPSGIGKFVIVSALGVFAATFTVHSWVLLHPFLRPVTDEIWAFQKFFLSIGFVIALLEQEVKTNHWLVAHDTLTGLPNRRHMDGSLLETILTGQAGVLLLDIDGFKKINDSMGREVGDDVLQRIALLLAQIIEADETLSRFSGARFVIVSPRSVSHLPQVLQALIAEPMDIDENHIQLTASAGTASFPVDAKGYKGQQAVAELLRVADRRMNQNKSGNKTSFLARWPSLTQMH